MASSTECYYSPVTRYEHLDRLAVFSSSLVEHDSWSQVHDHVEKQLAALDGDVRQFLAGVQVASGSTRGKQFLLFSYRTFSLPGSEIDPVVVGMTFTQTAEGIHLQADVSGEQAGDLITSVPSLLAPNSPGELLTAARQLALELCRSAKLIAAALGNPSRRVA